MIMLFGAQLAAAVASDTSAGWAATLEKNNGKLPETFNHRKIRGLRHSSNQKPLEELGPAIDDELLASYAAQFLDQATDIPFHRSPTSLNLSARHTMPGFDPESMQAMVKASGPAISEPMM